MTHTIYIQNLKCGGCANTILKKVGALEGITDVKVSNETNAVSFVSEKEEEVTKVEACLKTLGYPSVNETNSITTKAKSFVSCATGRINK